MINYDLPWNPNRLEQRMGRIHRYGQTKEVYIFNLVAADTREGRVMKRLFEKLEDGDDLRSGKEILNFPYKTGLSAEQGAYAKRRKKAKRIKRP